MNQSILRLSLIALLLGVLAFATSASAAQPIQVTTTGGYHPTVSPDGGWVAFQGYTGGIAMVRTDGSDYTQLTSMNASYDPDWARHNDSLLAYRHYDSTLGTVLIILNAVTLDTSLFFDGAVDDDPTWKPDGSAIAVQSASPDGIRIILTSDLSVFDVPCSDPDGTGCEGEGPTWSPDGLWLAFEDGNDVLKVAATGGTAVNLVNSRNVSSPSWSPDGDYIALHMDSAIWVIDADGIGFGAWQITAESLLAGHPTWAPTSDTVYFNTEVTGQSEIWKVYFDKQALSVRQDSPLLPLSPHLDQNYPNPFNATTEISFSLPARTQVTLEICDILGRNVGILVDGALESGRHVVTWNGASAASGVYLYRLRAGSANETRKMLLLK